MYFKPVRQKQEMIKFKNAFNLSNQRSNFFKNWGMQRAKAEFHEFHRQIFPHFLSKIAIIPTIFTGKHVKYLEISLETMTWGKNKSI